MSTRLVRHAASMEFGGLTYEERKIPSVGCSDDSRWVMMHVGAMSCTRKVSGKLVDVSLLASSLLGSLGGGLRMCGVYSVDRDVFKVVLYCFLGRHYDSSTHSARCIVRSCGGM